MRQVGLTAAVAAAAVAASLAPACGGGPTDDELEAWRKEAVAANDAALAAARRLEAAEPGHSLTICGQVRAGRTVLDWDALQRLGQTHVKTVSAQDPDHTGRVIDFRGVLVRDLLDQAGAGADEITFVSIDAFRAPVSAEDARRFRMLLALEADGAPIPRSQGGPLFLIHPYTESPETRTLYPDRYWSFYVTDLIVGTEPARLTIGNVTLDARTLDALPQASWEGVVKYKSYWPSEPVRLRGVRLRDALRAANAGVEAGGGVIVKGKAAIHHDPKDPRRIAAADLDRCDLLLATHWGGADNDSDQPIPARLGGPITLAVPDACAATYGDGYWMTFVEELELK